MSADVLAHLIADFGAVIGLPELHPDEDGRVNLMFDDIPVSIEESPRQGAVAIYSLIDQLPADMKSEEIYARLLNANYIHRETDGATLGVDADTRNIVLIREENLATLRPGAFESFLERFVNLAAHWKRAVYDAYEEIDSPASAPESRQTAMPVPGTRV